jgi:transposase
VGAILALIKGAVGRPSIAPGVYFRWLLLGYFEGIDSERGIAWRLADSLSMRTFIAYGLTEQRRIIPPFRGTGGCIRWNPQGRIPMGAEDLGRGRAGEGKTVFLDATTLEANAALQSLVRRDTGQKYADYLKDLAQAAGIESPRHEELARLDRKRKKKGSNREWKNPFDPDARIAKMKDGSTHMAHKAEHAVDLSSGALLAVTLQAADQGDTTTLHQTLAEAGEAVAELIEHEAAKMAAEEQQVHLGGIEEVVADKGYHSGAVLQDLHGAGAAVHARAEKRPSPWGGKQDEQKQVYANRRGMHLRGRDNILKRLLVHAGGFNLALIMRQVWFMLRTSFKIKIDTQENGNLLTGWYR